LEDEYLIQEQMESVIGVPKARSYKRMGQREQIEMELLPELHGH
jgi:hypothetical protein